MKQIYEELLALYGGVAPSLSSRQDDFFACFGREVFRKYLREEYRLKKENTLLKAQMKGVEVFGKGKIKI